MSLAAARAVLKVERSSSGEDVKKAYKKLALKHHPDKGGSADEFRRVNEAMEMCMDHLYEPASFSRSGLAAPDRRPGAGETSWADVKVYWTPGARGFGPMPMPYGPPPPLTRLPLAYFRDLLAGRVREAALAETADLDYLIVDARSEDERTATGEATLSSLGDIRLRVAIATLPPEACLDGSGDVVLPWVHTLADWANRKEARRLSETAKAALRAAESANDRGALVVVVSQTGSAIKHDRGDDEVAAEFLRNAQAPRARRRERWRVKSGGAIAPDVAMDSPVVCELRPGEIVALAELDDASPRVATSACGKRAQDHPADRRLDHAESRRAAGRAARGHAAAGPVGRLRAAAAARRRAAAVGEERGAALRRDQRVGSAAEAQTRETAADLRERARAAAEPPKPPPKKQWWETATPAEEEKWEPAPREKTTEPPPTLAPPKTFADYVKERDAPTPGPAVGARAVPVEDLGVFEDEDEDVAAPAPQKPPVAPDLDDDDPIQMPPLAEDLGVLDDDSEDEAAAPAPPPPPAPAPAPKPPPPVAPDLDDDDPIEMPPLASPFVPSSPASSRGAPRPGEASARRAPPAPSSDSTSPAAGAQAAVDVPAYTMASKIPTWAGAASFAVPIAVAYAADKASSRCETCLAVELGILCHLLHRLARVAAAPEGVLGEFGPLCAALGAIFFKPAWESTSTIAAVTLVGALLAAEVWRAGFADGSPREGAHDTWLTLCGAAWTYALYESPVAALLVLLPLSTIIRQDLVESINELKPVALRFGVLAAAAAALVAAAAFRLKKRGASALYQNVALAQLVVVPGAYALVAEPDYALAAVVAVAVAGAVVATELLDVAESKSDVLLVLALALVLVGPALQTSAIFGGAAPVAKPAAYQAKTTTTDAPPPPPPPEPEAAYAQAPQSGEDDDDDE
ncbi:DUF4483-containing protein [Aureococcus anophagefferens]|nr:DUF4483-containing protein [Aureococcus anophagefferens]